MIQQLVHAKGWSEKKLTALQIHDRPTISAGSHQRRTRCRWGFVGCRCWFGVWLLFTPTLALPLTALMEVSCSRGKITVKVNGESYLMPACLFLCTRKGGAAYLGLSIPLLGSCAVNDKTVSKHLAIKFSNKTDFTKERLLVLK